MRQHFGTSVGTEELAHFEMIGAIVYQLTKNLSMEQIEEQGFAPYYVDHTLALWPQAAGGIPFNACEFQSKGDVISDLVEDLAADGASINKQQYQFIKLFFRYPTLYFIKTGIFNCFFQICSSRIIFQAAAAV